MSLIDRGFGSAGHAAPGLDMASAHQAGPACREVWLLQRHKTPQQAFENANTARLAEALLAQGISARPVNPGWVDRTGGASQLRIGHRRLAPPSGLIGRSGSNTGAKARALSAMLEAAGTAAFPTARALALAGDKLSAGRLLSAAGLPVPDFEEIGPGTDAHALGRALGWPLVVKAARGSKGRSVRLVEGPEMLAKAISALIGQGPLMAQRFVAESRGRDIRVMVIGGTAIGAMAREAVGADAFRANIASGGRGRGIVLSPDIARLAAAAARAAGLEIAGVDLLHAAEGFTVGELNTAPGFVAFEAVTSIDVAASIAAHVANRLNGAEGRRPC
ncbi:MAG: RimK family alpha-L-glutamate ligase [Pseudomonadota bacterium]